MRLPNYFLLSGSDECPPMIEAFEDLENAQLAVKNSIDDIANDYDMLTEDVEENLFEVVNENYTSLFTGKDFYWFQIVPVEEVEWGD